MKLTKLSLAAALILGGFVCANGADTFAEAFTNGKLKAALKATYADKTDEGNKYQNENVLGVGFDLGYYTDPFYGLSLGIGAQGFGVISSTDDAKFMSNIEYYTNGVVFSEAYINYALGKTNFRYGRQYIDMPLVGANPSRAFKEAFEGITLSVKDVPETEFSGAWIYKYQGRTSNVNTFDNNHAPVFKNRIVLGGYGPAVGHEFDNVFTLNAITKAIKGLKLTGSWATVTNLSQNAFNAPSAGKDGDANLYFIETAYTIPFETFKVGLNLGFKGSNLTGDLDAQNYDGSLFETMFSIKDFYGFGFTYAYSNVLTGDDGVVLAVGLKPGTYTSMPIAGPFEYTGLAGMDAHKFGISYDFGQVGAKGLKAEVDYTFANQDAPSVNAGKTKAGTYKEIDGWGGTISYNVPQVKGLNASINYVNLDTDNYTKKDGFKNSTNREELWVKFVYKFDIL
ncbi:MULTISPECIES: OprD family outer membrane porin [Campylobacter]|uniref:OprD family outer membrane porin n=1 Tax=Campylobacter TaxID=194 RepID=UPI0023EFA576|nr:MULTISPECIES: OprD family outer membrane porin [Campylobacter]MCI6642462.1 OprD family outer membrane porin [Campylobacter sp.]MDD7422957.1 OprD family outer membrane porin [Campylobacter hominis]MDY3116870.1 OprD family outer membrane porin [Campylobacter hominis]